MEPQICGVVGLTPIGKSIEYDEKSSAKLGSKSKTWGFTSVEEITGGRIIEGFVYATKIIFPPKVRDMVVVDQLLTLINYCSETKRHQNSCEFMKPAIKCLRQLSAVWYFINEPRSNGNIFLYRNGSIEMDPKYFSDPKDLSDAIRGVQSLLKMTRQGGNAQEIYQDNSANSCSTIIHELISKGLDYILSNRRDPKLMASHELGFLEPSFHKEIFMYEINRYLDQTLSTWPPSIPDPTNEEEIEKYLKNTFQSIWHSSGTARLGDVVDGEFNLIGVKNLSIIDTSILPQMTRMNPTFTVMVLAHYAATKKISELNRRKFKIAS